jgi:ABC-2 type transport system ATP-binding protein
VSWPASVATVAENAAVDRDRAYRLPVAAAIIRAEELTKCFGANRGVTGLTFEVLQGEVFGYLGPNGAGKTTTIRLLLDLLRPTSGTVRVFGLDPRRDGRRIRAEIGYLAGDLRLYGRLTGRELLHYFGHLRGLPGIDEGEALARRFDLDLDRPIRTLSKGNRQKAGLVQALMHRPALLVLDEPTSGLDPLVQQVFYEIVREATADGRSVFLSSHVLSEVQRVADRVAVIREGELELVESVETLRTRAFTRVEATFATAPPADAFEGVPEVRVLERRGDAVLFALEGRADPLVKALARYEVIGLDSHEADLEDVFLALYRGEGADAS